MPILGVLTLLGAIIRFSYLNHPCLWGDEAMVYWRTCGTFADLLEVLQRDGFGPLHYELQWLIGHHFKPTPPVLRFMPALAGTLMIPAMYFLGRQLLQQSASLVVAALTAFSAFLIFYSRDAKMYSETWLFVALNAGCLLWWFRTRGMTAWLCWIAAGCATGGLHASSLIVVALAPLMFLTQRKSSWLRGIFLALGMAIILIGPVGYYFKYNHWLQNIDQQGWGASGIGWIEQFQTQTGPELVRYTSTNFLMGWTWPQEESERNIAAWLVKWSRIGAEVIAGLLVLALLPWPLVLRPRRDLDPPPEPQWRVFFWMAIWIVLPAYVFYCHSQQDFAAPIDWFHAGIGLLPASLGNLSSERPLVGWAIGLWVVGALVPGFVIRATRPAFLHGAKWVLAAAVVLLTCQLIYQICSTLSDEAILTNRRWHSIWVPRYLGVLWPAIAVATAALLMRLPTRPVRGLAILIVLGINVVFGFGRIFGHTEPPIDKMATDVYDAQRDTSRTRTYTDIRTGGPGPGEGTLQTFAGMYYLQMNAWAQPMTPDLFRESLSGFVFRNSYEDSAIADDVSRTPLLTHVIVWEEFESPPLENTDTLLPLLPGWNIQSEKWYPVRTYWDWQRMSYYRRRDYIRVSGPVGLPGK